MTAAVYRRERFDSIAFEVAPSQGVAVLSEGRDARDMLTYCRRSISASLAVWPGIAGASQSVETGAAPRGGRFEHFLFGR